MRVIVWISVVVCECACVQLIECMIVFVLERACCARERVCVCVCLLARVRVIVSEADSQTSGVLGKKSSVS